MVDFGVSRVYADREEMHDVIGSVAYMAPEVFSGHYGHVARSRGRHCHAAGGSTAAVWSGKGAAHGSQRRLAPMAPLSFAQCLCLRVTFCVLCFVFRVSCFVFCFSLPIDSQVLQGGNSLRSQYSLSFLGYANEY